MEAILEQITSLSLASINISLVIVLVGIGWVLKHLVPKLDNQYIPVALMCIGIVLVIALNVPFNAQEELLSLLVQGIASGFVAVMVHKGGKSIIGDLSSVTKAITEEVQE